MRSWGRRGTARPNADVLLDDDWSAIRTVVDVGGGTGGAAVRNPARASARHRHARSICRARSARAPEILAAAGVADRVTLRAQSFFDPLPGRRRSLPAEEHHERLAGSRGHRDPHPLRRSRPPIRPRGDPERRGARRRSAAAGSPDAGAGRRQRIGRSPSFARSPSSAGLTRPPRRPQCIRAIHRGVRGRADGVGRPLVSSCQLPASRWNSLAAMGCLGGTLVYAAGASTARWAWIGTSGRVAPKTRAGSWKREAGSIPHQLHRVRHIDDSRSRRPAPPPTTA